MNQLIPGFNGERLDPVAGGTFLGNGYRMYHPQLMRFSCPDAFSPFGDGGINAYAYCCGDPVNQADPDGHHSITGWLGTAVGIVLGVLLTPVSFGSSLAVTLSLLSVSTAVVSGGLAVAQQFIEGSDPKTASILGWAALATGMLSGLGSVALGRVVPGAKSLAGLFKGSSNRPFGGLMMTGADAPSSAGNAGQGILYTTYENMQLVRDTERNRGWGNCEYIAKRAFRTLLTGRRSPQRPVRETLSGIKKYADNFFPFRKTTHPSELYERMLNKINGGNVPHPEINTVTFSSKMSMENAMKKSPPFSVFWATSSGEFMGVETGHSFILARGARAKEYYIFDRFSEDSHHVATREPSRYFDIYTEFEVEVTGFL